VSPSTSGKELAQQATAFVVGHANRAADAVV
jgi:hypothetical protein